MSDFAQTGLICTLHTLNDSHSARIEEELAELAAAKPVALVLPCHGADFDRPALRHVCSELASASWLSEVLVSMNGLDAGAYEKARRYFDCLPQPHRLLWNDGPALRQIHRELLAGGAESLPHGKGLNVWAAAGVLCQEGKAEILLTQDCDVASFRRSGLARLCYACAHPKLGFAFAKMYYSRVTDRLYGRVSRLFLAPLLQSFLRVAGHQPMFDFLRSFRYPLAGESAIRRELAAELAMSPGWGLEIGTLCQLFRIVDPRQVCQVDGGSGYDHKHQPVAQGLLAMCREIAAALFAEFAREGLTSSPSFRDAVTAAYRKEGRLALQRSAALALINGLPFDEAVEGEIVAAFAEALKATALLEPPRNLPAWSQLLRGKPELCARLTEAAQ